MNPKDRYSEFQDDSDLNNKNISLQAPNTKNQSNSIGNNTSQQPVFMQKMAAKSPDDIIAGIVIRESNNVSEKISSTIISNLNEKLNFIGQYFNVEADDIKEKLISAILPFNRNFHLVVENNPDLYGPFWIFTTLIFLISLTGNLSNFLESTHQETFKYNFNFIPNAAMIIYLAGFGLPIFLFFLMKFVFKVDIPLVLNICVYGYSYAPLAPILFLCMIPVDGLQTLLLFYYTVQSSFFLVYNMWQFIVEKAQASKFVILGILIGFQIVLFLIFKFYFFASFGKKD